VRRPGQQEATRYGFATARLTVDSCTPSFSATSARVSGTRWPTSADELAVPTDRNLSDPDHRSPPLLETIDELRAASRSRRTDSRSACVSDSAIALSYDELKAITLDDLGD
jgi:hypothetical protein